jgi:hypothetical protein
MFIRVSGACPVHKGWAVDAHSRPTWCNFMICQSLSWVVCLLLSRVGFGVQPVQCSVAVRYGHGCFRVAEYS